MPQKVIGTSSPNPERKLAEPVKITVDTGHSSITITTRSHLAFALLVF